MKKFSYNKNKALIRTLKEPPPRKKSVNWDRISFLSAIAVGLFFLLRYLFVNLYYIEADGQVFLENLDVQFTDDVRLKSLFVSEGDCVEKGDTLFTYAARQFDDEGSYTINKFSQRDWIIREKLSLEKDIYLKRQMLEELEKRQAFFQSKSDQTKKLILLDASNVGHLNQVKKDLHFLEAEIAVVQKEIEINWRYLRKLNGLETQFIDPSTGGYSSALVNTIYTSPIDGIIGQIETEVNEVCYEGENVLVIHRTDKISIKAYFNQEYLSNINPGDLVEVKFPDGSKGKGVIASFNIATFALPSEFQKRYEPTERTILTEIVPLNDFETYNWRQFFKMDVVVSKPRFELF